MSRFSIDTDQDVKTRESDFFQCRRNINGPLLFTKLDYKFACLYLKSDDVVINCRSLNIDYVYRSGASFFTSTTDIVVSDMVRMLESAGLNVTGHTISLNGRLTYRRPYFLDVDCVYCHGEGCSANTDEELYSKMIEICRTAIDNCARATVEVPFVVSQLEIWKREGGGCSFHIYGRGANHDISPFVQTRLAQHMNALLYADRFKAEVPPYIPLPYSGKTAGLPYKKVATSRIFSIIPPPTTMMAIRECVELGFVRKINSVYKFKLYTSSSHKTRLSIYLNMMSETQETDIADAAYKRHLELFASTDIGLNLKVAPCNQDGSVESAKLDFMYYRESLGDTLVAYNNLCGVNNALCNTDDDLKPYMFEIESGIFFIKFWSNLRRSRENFRNIGAKRESVI